MVTVVDEPRDRACADTCLVAIERIYKGGTPPVNHAMREDVEMTHLIASWFRSRPYELQRTILPEAIQARLRADRGSSRRS